MSDDIVTRLRLFNYPLEREAADEIERLRTQLEMWQDGNIMSESHHDEIKRLTAERDEARREVCNLRPSVCLGAQTAVEFANHRGWDCFKEDGK